jgi:glyceraldehyde 3-phosphate dehydrogenase
MRKIKVAINGFGRIGRHVLKVALQNKKIQIVAINDLTDNKTLAHLLKYDTAYAGFTEKVAYDNDCITVGKTKILAFAERNPEKLPWKDLNIDVVIESTGIFRDMEGAKKHLAAGAKKVIISAPSKGDGISSYVRGVNCEEYIDEQIIDNASCTTNCTAPVMKVLEDVFGVEKAMLTTVHSYTADQRLQDGPHKDLRRARAAAQNIVPTSTGAAIATAKVIPSLEGKFDGMAIRVPTVTVSLIDITVVLGTDVTKEEVNKAFIKATKGKLKNILFTTEEPLVSSDYIGNPASATVDLEFTNVVGGNLVKIIAWYDNEWGYANRLVEMIKK